MATNLLGLLSKEVLYVTFTYYVKEAPLFEIGVYVNLPKSMMKYRQQSKGKEPIQLVKRNILLDK
jgi:hypothetical protein